MPLPIAAAEADELLAPIRTGLEADGYRLNVSAAGEALRIDVEATPEACADCLVPKGIMETMVRQALAARDGLDAVAIEIGYPADH
ncbi:MAG TPA: hypothetical protein VGQ42_13725 [Candidatus Dormibacteraeota bacterium]|jgi:hypothetical protein|nr:hypothetical protein [Candidatus Dormibacteraeota bacterium]